MADHAEDRCEEDEDVVLHGSPLAQYLHEVGSDDFSTFSTDAVSMQRSDKISNSVANVRTEIVRPVNTLLHLGHFLKKFLGINMEKNELILTCRREILLRLQNSNFIEGTDIETKEKDLDSVREDGLISKHNSSKRLSSLATIGVVISLVIAVWLDPSEAIPMRSLILPCCILISLAFTMLFMWQEYALSQIRKSCKNTLTAVDRFIESSEMFCQSIDKSILLIREFEVIAMGLTYYHPNLPTLQTGLQKNGMCCSLRQSMLESLLKSFELFKAISILFIDILPKEVKPLYLDKSLSNVPVSEIMSSLQIDNLVKDSYIATDVLKSLVCLNKAQLTEIFQVLTVIFNQDYFDGNDHAGDLDSQIKSIGNDFLHRVSLLNGIINDVKSRCKFTKENEFKVKTITKQNRLINPNKGDIAHLMTRIDSAALHLKSSLDRLTSIEDLLTEKLMQKEESDVNSSLSASEFETFKEMVTVFNHGIDSAKTCIEDLENRLQTPSKGTEKTEEVNDIQEVDNSFPRFFDITTMEPEGDLYLEGTSEPFSDSSTMLSDDVSLAEQNRLRQEMKESKRLMSELKAIFSLKKSPVGLVPFELVKKAVNVEAEGESQDCNEMSNDSNEFIQEENPCLTAISKLEHNTFWENEELFDEGSGSNEEHFIDYSHDDPSITKNQQASGFCKNDISGNFMSDLASEITKRTNNFGISEQTLEADTFSMSDNEYSD